MFDIGEIDGGLVSVIDFSSLYTTAIEKKFVADIKTYNLDSSKIAGDVSRLLKHHIIHGVCEAIKSCSSSQKCIVYFCSLDLKSTSTYDLFGSGIISLIEKILEDIKNKLPIRVYTTKITFKYYTELKKQNKNKGIAITEELVLYGNKEQNGYTFNKVKKYASRNGLTFLNQSYFNSITNKMLIAR